MKYNIKKGYTTLIVVAFLLVVSSVLAVLCINNDKENVYTMEFKNNDK